MRNVQFWHRPNTFDNWIEVSHWTIYEILNPHGLLWQATWNCMILFMEKNKRQGPTPSSFSEKLKKKTPRNAELLAKRRRLQLLIASRLRNVYHDWTPQRGGEVDIRDVPDIHPVPGKCQVSHYSVLSGPGKIMGPSNKKLFFLPEVLMIS